MGLMWLVIAHYGGLYETLAGPAKSTNHPSGSFPRDLGLIQGR